MFFKNVSPIVNLNTDLVAYYKFNSDLTASVGGINGTGIGSPTYTTGIISQSVNLGDGTTVKYITLADNNMFSFTSGGGVDISFSISCWVYVLPLSKSKHVINKVNVSNHEWHLYITSTNKVTITLMNSSPSSYIQITTNNSITTNSWNHIVVTYNGSKTASGLKIYIDRIEQSYSIESVGTYVGMANGTAPVRVGNWSTQNTSDQFPGYIDELGIWKNRELTESEISYLYNSGIGRTYPF